MSEAIEKTNRGFGVYGEGEHRNGTWKIQESSIAFEGAHVWIFHTPFSEPGRCVRDSLQLSVPQAKEVIEALSKFVRDAEAGVLIEPAEASDE